MTPTVAMVYKRGRFNGGHRPVEYRAEHVAWLAEQIRQHTTAHHRLVCLTDAELRVPGVEAIPLLHDWPGWWAKIELFRIPGPVVYLDLDTVVLGNIDHMITHRHTFTALRAMSRDAGQALNSGFMAWGFDFSRLYHTFAEDPERWQAKCRTPKCWGDQGYIDGQLGGEFDRWQDLYPGQVASYKNDLKGRPPAHTVRVVCFHGKPKPWEVSAPWVPRISS